MPRRKCDRCGRPAIIRTVDDEPIQERFCRRHRSEEIKAMKRDGYLTQVPKRPYFSGAEEAVIDGPNAAHGAVVLC